MVKICGAFVDFVQFCNIFMILFLVNNSVFTSHIYKEITMNAVLENIKTRRSIRRYKPDMVETEKLEKIIEAGLYAPSGMGQQKTIIVAIKNKEIRDKLAEINRKIAGWEEGVDPFYGAPVVIIVLAEKGYFTGIYDGSLVIGNMMLAAHSLGVGSCWIHRAKEEFEMPEYKDFLKSLEIEGEYEGVGHCILGYADGAEPHAAPRKEKRVYYIDY